MQWTDAWSVRMEHVLRDAIYTLLEIGNATLPDILRLLRDKSHRKSVIARISNPLVRDFWRLEFEHHSYRYRADAVAPIPNKVGAGNCSLLRINPVPPERSDLRAPLAGWDQELEGGAELVAAIAGSHVDPALLFVGEHPFAGARPPAPANPSDVPV